MLTWLPLGGEPSTMQADCHYGPIRNIWLFILGVKDALVTVYLTTKPKTSP
jgi:hypothetical protein